MVIVARAIERSFFGVTHVLDLIGKTKQIYSTKNMPQPKVSCINDRHIRKALLANLKSTHYGDPDTLVVEELGLCQGISRIDVALINGTTHGFEIKSAKDDLSRLPAQVRIYNKVLDSVTVVASRCHLAGVRQIVPKWWGISVAEEVADEIRIVVRRQAKVNPLKESEALVQLLWREEALHALGQFGSTKGVMSKPREEIWKRLVACTSLDQLSQIVRNQLKSRPHWRSDLPQN